MGMQILISGNYNAFKEGYNACGVYMASGLAPSATFERPIYIGSSKDLVKRIQGDHFKELRNKNHLNIPFQNSWDKHGGENIIWFLLESCEIDKLPEREQFYLDYYRPFCDERRGFNIARFTDAPMRGRTHNASARVKIGEKTKQFWKSEEYRTLQKQKRASSDKNQERIREQKGIYPAKFQVSNNLRKKSAWLTDGNGITVFVNGINAFCEAKGLVRQNLSRVINGKRKSCGGWRLSSAEEITAAGGTI